MQRLISASIFTDHLDNVTGEGDELLEQAIITVGWVMRTCSRQLCITVGCVVDKLDERGVQKVTVINGDNHCNGRHDNQTGGGGIHTQQSDC